MRSFLRHIAIDCIRLFAAITALFIGSVYMTVWLAVPILVSFEYLGGSIKQVGSDWVFGACAAFLAVLAIIPVLFPFDRLIDIKVGARKPSARELEVLNQVRTEYERLARETRHPIVGFRLRMCDDPDVNAIAYGRNSVALTTGLIRKAQEETDAGFISAVLAHEIGHIVNHDTRFRTFLESLYTPMNIILKITNLFSSVPLLGIAISLITYAAFIPIRIVENVISLSNRAVEYRADAYAFAIAGPQCVLKMLDYFARCEKRTGETLGGFLSRSHPPSELRHDRIMQLAAIIPDLSPLSAVDEVPHTSRPSR